MHVQVIANGADEGTTGLGRYGRMLFQELQRTGIDVELTPPVVPFARILHSLGNRLNLDPVTFLSNYPVKTKHRQADVYHLASENLASVLMFHRIRPVVVTVHAFFTYFLRNDPHLSMHNNAAYRAFDSLAARGLRRADAIIAVSNYVADLLIDELSIPPDRIYMIHEAVNREVFRPREVQSVFRENYQLDPACFYYLYVGSEQPRKNFLMLLKAFARVRAKYSKVRLIKVGAPEFQVERNRAVALIEDLDITNDVKFIGHVGDELPLFYNASDVFVFPSLYEGFGFPPLEAMACGTPVICSNTTSLPEVVGESALLFSPDDEDMLVKHMLSMIEDPTQRMRLRSQGIARAREFSWSKCARDTLAVYNSVQSRDR